MDKTLRQKEFFFLVLVMRGKDRCPSTLAEWNKKFVSQYFWNRREKTKFSEK